MVISSGKLLVLGVAVAISVLASWQIGGRIAGTHARNAGLIGLPANGEASHRSTDQQPTAVLPSATSGSVEKPRSASSGTIDEKLAEFELYRDLDLLPKLQAQFTNNPKVIIVSCLEEEAPNSIWLTLLDSVEPENSLPDLLRAGYWAKVGNSEEMAKELTHAVSKSALTTHVRERQIKVFDLGQQDGIQPNVRSLIAALDMGYFRRMVSIGQALTANPHLFGNQGNQVSMAYALAAKLRQMEGFGYDHVLSSDAIEAALIEGLPLESTYGGPDLTVRQRLEQMKADMRVEGKKMTQLKTMILDESADASLSLKFYTRLRKNGQEAAMNWLLTQSK